MIPPAMAPAWFEDDFFGCPRLRAGETGAGWAKSVRLRECSEMWGRRDLRTSRDGSWLDDPVGRVGMLTLSICQDKRLRAAGQLIVRERVSMRRGRTRLAPSSKSTCHSTTPARD